MISISLDVILKTINGELITKNEEDFVGVSTDTRKIKNGNIFIALKGEKYDANNFLVEACRNGASCIITSNKQCFEGYNCTVIYVEDTLKALQQLAKYYVALINPKVVAITGSTGKTTTKDMLKATIESNYKVHYTKGNFNNHIGLPLTILDMPNDTEVLILEMGMNHYGEIDLLCDIARPNVGIITNIGTSHIEFFGSKENIMKSKLEITNYFGENDVLILNGYDNLLINYNSKSFVVKHTGDKSGFISYSDYKVIEGKSLTYKLHKDKNVFSVKMNIIGVHNVQNSLLVLQAACDLGMDIDDAILNIGGYKGSDMRFNVYTKNGYTLVNDAYNASNDSMIAAINSVKEIAKSRRILVLGDMLEMGSEAEFCHRQLGDFINESGVDAVFTYGENSKFLVEQCDKIDFAKNYSTKDELFNELIYYLKTNDTILFKASRGMAMETVFNKIIEEL